MSQAFPKPGDLFMGRYRIAKVIGAGGFAQVYRAVQEDLEREVALKILIPASDGPEGSDRATYSQKLVQRFHQEAKLVSRLRDPHTITMYDYGNADNGLLYMVFEYINGLSLSQVVNRSGAIAASRVIKILKQTLSSLHEAHALGMLHRDLKPANIMIYEHVGRPDQVKLLDFGIAKVFSEKEAPVNDLTTDGAIVGTPRYMSPEQILGKPLTPASDLYSLGLVAYEMLVGQKANDSHTSMTVIGRQLDPNSFAIPPELAIPPDLRRIIDKMIVKNPDQRWQSAAEVMAALDAIGDDSAVRRITGVNQAVPRTDPHMNVPVGVAAAYSAGPGTMTPPPGYPQSGRPLTNTGPYPAAGAPGYYDGPPTQTGVPPAYPIDPTPSGMRPMTYPSHSQTFPVAQAPPAQGNNKVILFAALVFGAVAILGIGAYVVLGSKGADPAAASAAVAGAPSAATAQEGQSKTEANAAAAGSEQSGKLRVTTHPTDVLIKIGDRAVGRSPVDIDVHGLSFPLTVTAQLDADIQSSVFLNRPDRPVFIDLTSQIEARKRTEQEEAERKRAEEERRRADEERQRAEAERARNNRGTAPVRTQPAKTTTTQPAAAPATQTDTKPEESRPKTPTFHIPSMEGL
jgi:eukaryotic-like serine/threonine-protein kinase